MGALGQPGPQVLQGGLGGRNYEEDEEKEWREDEEPGVTWSRAGVSPNLSLAAVASSASDREFRPWLKAILRLDQDREWAMREVAWQVLWARRR